MSRVITERFQAIFHATTRRRSRDVLILLSISLILSGKTFGTPIVAQTLEFDVRENSSSPADQTTDLQWSSSTSAFDVNLNVITREIFNQEVWQAIRGVNNLAFYDAQPDQTYPSISFRSDSFSLDRLV